MTEDSPTILREHAESLRYMSDLAHQYAQRRRHLDPSVARDVDDAADRILTCVITAVEMLESGDLTGARRVIERATWSRDQIDLHRRYLEYLRDYATGPAGGVA